MLVIGLTGGIGSGKSTVSGLFAAKGIEIIDTDVLAHELTKPGEPALQKIIETFGSDLLQPDGTLDRIRLRKIIFTNDVKRQHLEDLLHPLIRDELAKRVAAIDGPYCIAMIPLLLETKPNPLINRILVVDTSEKLQISRTAARDKISNSDVEDILKTQVTREKRLAMADDVIENDGDYEDLISQVDELHEKYLSLADGKA